MTKKLAFTRAILASVTVSLAMFCSDAALAAQAAPPPGGAPVARILMVDLRRVIAESKVGHDIERQVEQLKAQATVELKGEGQGLQREQVALQQQAAILAADVKARRIKDFETKREAFQEKVQQRGALIQGGVMKAQSQVEQALGPVLQGIMRERGATIMMDRSAVLLGPSALDVTAIATQRLDTKMTTVKVELTAPPSGAGGRAQPQQQ
jgi:outer membrane protein